MINHRVKWRVREPVLLPISPQAKMQSRRSMSDTNDYPITHREHWLLRLSVVMVAISLCGMGAVIASTRGPGGSYLGGGFVIALGLFVATMVLGKTMLYEDRISQSGVLGTRELRREDIQGYRVRRVKRSTFFDLIPVHEQLKKISVEKSYFKDGAFTAWIARIPNLDEVDQRAVDLETERDESLGATPEQRKARVQLLKKIALYLSLGYMVVCFIVAVFPDPEWLALTVIATGPLIAMAMVLLSAENFTIVETEKKILLRKGSLLQMLVSPAIPIIILLTSQMDDRFRFPLDWHPLLLPALAGGAAMTAAIWLVSRNGKVNIPVLLTMSLPMMVYAGGVTALANSAFDQHDARSYALTVVKKYRTTGKGAAEFFTVASDDPAYTGAVSIKVPYKLYLATGTGGTVCAQIHPGFFSMNWETISACE